jgi:serine/threonine protein kinase
VYKVKRKSDGIDCVMKFITSQTEGEKKNILNEVGIMLLCKESENIVKCYECFENKNKLWIFLEMMNGGSLTQMVEETNGKVSEGFCKYACLQVLKGLKYLHDR